MIDKNRMLEPDELDELLDSGIDPITLLGTRVEHTNLGGIIGVLELLDNGRLASHVSLTCGPCLREKREPPYVIEAWLGSGLHRGAWCYVFDREGNYLANLRDQEPICRIHES